MNGVLSFGLEVSYLWAGLHGLKAQEHLRQRREKTGVVLEKVIGLVAIAAVFNNLLIGPPAFNNFPAIIDRHAGNVSRLWAVVLLLGCAYSGGRERKLSARKPHLRRGPNSL